MDQRTSKTGEQSVLSSVVASTAPVKISFFSTLDWLGSVSCLVLLVLSPLLIVNGSCSQPSGLKADSPVCKGGQLSVQSWLAIVGVEFSAFGTILAPRAIAVLTSKYITSKAGKRNGVNLASILNSQLQAPFWSQVANGSKRTVALRVFYILLTIAISILYKFSFVRVALDGSLLVEDISDSDGASDLFYFNSIPLTFQDYLASNPLSVQIYRPGGLGEDEEIIFANRFNTTSTNQLLNGVVYQCRYTNYSRHIVTRAGAEWSLSSPPVLETPYDGGVRIHNTLDDTVLDISDDHGNLIAMYGTFKPEIGTLGYLTQSNVTVQYCAGHLSWTNSKGYQQYELQYPDDISCAQIRFSVGSWKYSKAGVFAQDMVQTLLPRDYYYDQWLSVYGLEVILAALDVSDGEDSLSAALEDLYGPWMTYIPSSVSYRFAKCKDFNYFTDPALVRGIIADGGTGMTMFGIALQGIILLLSVCAAVIFAWPSLPLVGEWSAQWLALMYDMDREVLLPVIKKTAAGTNGAGGLVTLFLQKEQVDKNEARLRLQATGPFSTEERRTAQRR